MALYAALGLYGVVAFHGGGPSLQDLTTGYGVVYSAANISKTIR